MKPVRVTVNDKMQKGYVYLRSRPMGRDFRPGFKPQLTPKQMLKLGVFGGKYMTDCGREFPASWFKNAKLCAKRHEPSLNYFGVNASQLLPSGARKVGSTTTIREAGFNGIVVTIPAGVARTTCAK